jgi:diacylglycerol kinase (ATP)
MDAEFKELLFIVNTGSGKDAADDIGEKIKTAADKYGQSWAMATIEAGNTDIEKYIRQYNPKTVIAVGGDGTVNLCASLIVSKDIRLGIIPAGSANGLATNLNLPSDFSEALQNIIEGSVVLMDVLCINEKKYCFHLSDIGLNARIVRNFEKEGKRGMWGYTKQMVREAVFKRDVFTCEISAGIIKETLKAEMVVIANASRYGTGLIINPDGNLFDGVFEIIIIKPFSVFMVIMLFFNLLTGKIKKMNEVRVIKSTSATIKMKKIQVIHVDGEVVRGIDEMKISILPSVLKVVV